MPCPPAVQPDTKTTLPATTLCATVEVSSLNRAEAYRTSHFIASSPLGAQELIDLPP